MNFSVFFWLYSLKCRWLQETISGKRIFKVLIEANLRYIRGRTLYLLFVTRCFLSVTRYFLLVMRYFLLDTYYSLLVTRYFFLVASYFLLVIFFPLLFPCCLFLNWCHWKMTKLFLMLGQVK